MKMLERYGWLTARASAWVADLPLRQSALTGKLDKETHSIRVDVGSLLQQILNIFGAAQNHEVLCE